MSIDTESQPFRCTQLAGQAMKTGVRQCLLQDNKQMKKKKKKNRSGKLALFKVYLFLTSMAGFQMVEAGMYVIYK